MNDQKTPPKRPGAPNKGGDASDACDNTVACCKKKNWDLVFAVRFYNTYECYTWSRFYKHKDYGEIGPGNSFSIRGDRNASTAMKDGYVYLFKEGAGLKHAFAVKAGKYREVTVSGQNVDYTAFKGPERGYVYVEKFYGSEDEYKDGWYAVASFIKLSPQRLFTGKRAAIVKDPRKRGKSIEYSIKRIRDASKDRRSGPRILDDYRKSKSSPSLLTYDYLHHVFDGMEGFYLHLPDVEKETLRRNRIFRDRWKRYQAWLNNRTRTRKAFIHTAVRSILDQDAGKKSYIDKAKYDAWRRKDIEEFRMHFFPVHYAVKNVIEWMDEKFIDEWERDYSFGTDEQQQHAAKVHAEGIKEIGKTEDGAKFLGEKYSDKNGYIAQSTGLLALKAEYRDPDSFNNFYVEIRKWNNVAFSLFEEIAPILVAKEKAKSLDRISDFIKKVSGYTLSRKKVKPLQNIAREMEVLDTESLLRKVGAIPNTKGGKILLNSVELGNVAFAVYGLSQSKGGLDALKNSINLLGAMLDFTSSNWLLTKSLANKLGEIRGAKVVQAMVLVSGIVDCVLGVWEAARAWKQGEYDVFIGWSFFALGGAVIAVGAGMKMAGAKATVGSGGAAAKPGACLIVLGLIVEGVGLAIVYFCNNDEIEDWLTQCEFGRKPAGKSLDKQIQDLNDILCKFEVEAEFKDTAMKFRNHTKVTVKIKPRVITDTARISFSDTRALAYARTSEYIFGTRHDRVTGGSHMPAPTIYLNKMASNCRKYVENNRIALVEVDFFFQMDIDRVKGKIELKLNNGTLQGYTRAFNCEA